METKVGLIIGQYRCNYEEQDCIRTILQYTEERIPACSALPSFNFCEVEGDLSVGNGFLVQVPTIPSDERRHVVACNVTPQKHPPQKK